MTKKLHRRQLIRAALTFQLKLFFDWLRDLVFSPLSACCAVIDILRGTAPEQALFYRLLAWGAVSDRWINLFGDHPAEEHAPYGSVDAVIEKVASRRRAAADRKEDSK